MPHIAGRALREWQHIRQRHLAERKLQQTHLELVDAYETTLLGWCMALDLRDHETTGHTQRVVALSLSLASMLDLPEEELVHLKRGALLHDIGKMGIPDQILLKPGPLTDAEWVIMKKHPVYAYEWLSGIKYLHPALTIPYYHHERWDGTGYPVGLKGTDIPLTARIFAIVDVWDALTSNRPYRSAWSPEKTFDYILRGEGSHFDPQLIQLLRIKGIGILRDINGG
jgi:HD-GYP domain-containing protein (c-di-GMP phosphodiesterase class II)